MELPIDPNPEILKRCLKTTNVPAENKSCKFGLKNGVRLWRAITGKLIEGGCIEVVVLGSSCHQCDSCPAGEPAK